MNIGRIISSSFLLLTLSFNLHATSTTAVNSASQEWSDPASWNNGVPGCFDTIVIPSSVFIQVTEMTDLSTCGPIVLMVFGELHFQTGKKLNLPANSTLEVSTGGIVTGGGGGGNSSYIEIGTQIVWAASDGDLVGPITLCPSCPLSVELDYYILDQDELGIHLLWRTMSEMENDYFILERKKEGESWGFLAKTDGSGTTGIPCDYSFFDSDNLRGTFYYKLIQFDINGDSEVLGIKSVNIESELVVESAYNMMGQRQNMESSDLQIVRYTNGQTKIMYK